MRIAKSLPSTIALNTTRTFSALLIVALSAPIARAQTTPPAGKTTSAPPTAPIGMPYTRGMEAYKHNDINGAIELLTQAVKLDDQNGDAQAVLGFLLAQQGKYDRAMPHLEKAATLKTTVISPSNSQMNLGKALLMRPEHSAGDTARAVGLFEKAVALAPKSTEAQLALGFGYTRLGDFDKAAGAYRAATVLAPKNAAAWKGLGVSLRKAGHVDDAAVALQKSAALNGQDADTWITLGELEMQRGDNDAAQNAMETARKLDPKNLLVLVALGTVYSHQNRAADAAEAYGAAADQMEASGVTAGAATDLATLRYDQGVAYAQAGRIEDAAAAYDKVLTINPHAPEALLNSGTILYNQHKYAEAALRFKAAATAQPSSTLAWRNLAAACASRKDWTGAADAGRKLVALLPNDYDAHDGLVDAILQVNPTSDEAAKYYRQMATLHPASADPLIGLGLLYQRQAEAASLASAKQAKLLAAMQTFERALAREPKSAIAYNDLGVVHERRGELDDAIKDYKKALALDPKLTDASKNLARFHPAAPTTAPAPPKTKAPAATPKPPAAQG